MILKYWIYLNNRTLLIFEKMDAMQKEVKLLKDYTATLEHENEARNNEKNTLFAEIDRLTAENDHLTSLLAQKGNITSSANESTTIKSIQNQLKIVKETNSSLKVEINNLNVKIVQLTSENNSLKSRKVAENYGEIDGLKASIARLTSDVSSKDRELQTIIRDKQSLQSQLSALKQASIQTDSSRSQVIILQRQVQTYKNRVNELTTKDQNHQSSLIKISELQNAKRVLLSKLDTIESKYQKLDIDFRKLEIENKELKNNSRSATETSNLLSTKLSLQTTIRQLNSKVQWVEGSNRTLEREKKQSEKRMSELERELYDVKGRLTQLKFNEQSYKNSEANISIKQKEMQALQNMISNLKDNKRHLQKTVRQKQQIITNLQSQIYNFRSTVHNRSDIDKQVNQLRMIKSTCERQMSTLNISNQELNIEVNNLRSQVNVIATQLQTTRDERDRLIQENYLRLERERQDIKSRRVQAVLPQPVSSNVVVRQRNQDDIRLMVSRLQQEVQDMKSSSLNQNQFLHYNHHNCKSNVLLHPKVGVYESSPVKDSHIKTQSRVVIPEKDKQTGNRQKWQSLQRKITMLRSENENLKRSLFD